MDFGNFRTPTLDQIARELNGPDKSTSNGNYFQIQVEHSNVTGLKKELRWPQLILLGIGCTIGAGIFVVTGAVVSEGRYALFGLSSWLIGQR